MQQPTEDKPIVQINEDMKVSLDQFTKSFEQFVVQETQNLQNELKRILDVVQSGGMGKA